MINHPHHKIPPTDALQFLHSLFPWLFQGCLGILMGLICQTEQIFLYEEVNLECFG